MITDAMVKVENQTYELESPNWSDDTPEENLTLLITFEIIACVIGLIGNALVIFVILALGEYEKAVTNWYILQLALADSLFLLTLPFKVIEQVNDQWIFSSGMCKAKETILFLNYYSSILFLTVMSVDRYIALCHAFSRRLQKLRKKFFAYTITVGVWTVSACLCTPIIMYSDKAGIHPSCKCQYEFPLPTETPEEKCRKSFGYEEGLAFNNCLTFATRSVSESSCKEYNISDYDNIFTEYPSENDEFGSTNSSGFDVAISSEDDELNSEAPSVGMECSYVESSSGWRALIMFNFIVMFIIPFLVTCVCYLLIALRLQNIDRRRMSIKNDVTSSRSASGYGKSERRKSAASTSADRKTIRVTFVCLIMVLLFLVCWLPFHSVHLAKMAGIEGTDAFCNQLSAATALLAYFNSVLNPYVYNFVGKKFLKRLRLASGAVSGSMKKRTSSLSSRRITMHYKSRKSSMGTSSNSGTVFTKIHRGKSDAESSRTPSIHENSTQA